MDRPLKIVVADDEQNTLDFLREMLSRRGHQVVTATNGKQLVELCRAAPPDLIITDVRMPEMDGIQATEIVNREKGIPVILLTAYHSPGLLNRFDYEHVMSYLVKPVQESQVEAAVSLASQRFERLRAAREEVSSLRQAQEDRKVTERAKGVLMKRLCLSEGEAFLRLRKLSVDENRKVTDVEQQIIKAEEIFHVLECK